MRTIVLIRVLFRMIRVIVRSLMIHHVAVAFLGRISVSIVSLLIPIIAVAAVAAGRIGDAAVFIVHGARTLLMLWAITVYLALRFIVQPIRTH